MIKWCYKGDKKMLNANKVSLMKELILKIKDADKAYFVDDNPIMTDKEYDEMVEKLKDEGIDLTKD